MAKRTIRVRQWRHKTKDGGYRISRFGDVVDLPVAEVGRGDRQGVFTPTVAPATRSAEVDRTLADIASQIPIPAGAEGSDAATLHHDITRDRAIAESAAADFLALDGDAADAEQLPADELPAETPQDEPDAAVGAGDTTEAENDTPALKRPAKAASVDVWRAYIAAVKPELADEVAGMSKDELQAQAPKDD